MIEAQDGDAACCADVSKLPQARVICEVPATQSGSIHHMDTIALGSAAQQMGAGRATKADVIDHSVGFVLHQRIGMCVEAGESLATVHAKDQASAQAAVQAIQQAICISQERAEPSKLIHAFVDSEHVERL